MICSECEKKGKRSKTWRKGGLSQQVAIPTPPYTVETEGWECSDGHQWRAIIEWRMPYTCICGERITAGVICERGEKELDQRGIKDKMEKEEFSIFVGKKVMKIGPAGKALEVNKPIYVGGGKMKTKNQKRIDELEDRIKHLENDTIPARRIIVQVPDYGHHVVCPGISVPLPKLINLLLEELNLGLVKTPVRLNFEKVVKKRKV